MDVVSEPLSIDGTPGQNFLIARRDFHDRRVALTVHDRSGAPRLSDAATVLEGKWTSSLVYR
jgi:hypothetical protein